MQWLLQDVSLGKNIQRIRTEKNMTQAQVAEKLQLMGSLMSRSTLANIESGRRNIKVSDLKALRSVLGVEYDAFFRD
ncbi:helix-turn-helix transcriptional regulator [Oscillibacter sp.]|uniref:helix-turn-helix domain-containing protein n=1 Tax=Oscillibacter sp. TaxID=1945593 RepID=UPI002604513B|nr:helix-turn-helix transcriptional regulator [Oscillibacter sp.]MDD3346834.1 helix-turn-helix transcriptional regulator [Oscillibacter sp.]